MANRPARMSPQARAWLLAEIKYLADRNPSAAAAVVERMRAARQTLGDYPRIGVAGLISGTRRLVVGPYVLAVRQRDDIVEIAAIRHARQSDAYAPPEATKDEQDDAQ
jgi:plasmid stabilization system protein ParE